MVHVYWNKGARHLEFFSALYLEQNVVLPWKMGSSKKSSDRDKDREMESKKKKRDRSRERERSRER